jgi:hypothetical protein
MHKMAVVAVMVVALSLAGALQAQNPNATLTGRVTDPSKAVIRDANVILINTSTNVSYGGKTNGTGTYYVTNLPPGTYRMEVEKLGFKTVIKPEIVLHVQDALEINYEMALGSLSETVTVEAGAPALQLSTSSVSAVVNSTTVRELPLNGRSWTDLATLQPGVAAIQTQKDFSAGGARGDRGFGAQVTISGARPQQNNYRLDGISINDYANGAPGSVLGGDLGVDGIQEFSVLTSNYSAEFGKTSGGVINAITRSGTDQFHGSVYEFLRNSALDARNFFDGSKIPPFRRNQFGAAAGGPIRKDHTFVFGDYEGIRQSKGISVVSFVPSPDARAGKLSTGPVTVDPSVQQYLPLYPLPNGPILAPGDIGTFTFAGQQVVDENFFTTRVDHKLSQKDNLFGTYMYDDTTFTLPDSFDDLLNGHHTRRQVIVLGEDHIFSPNLVNSARFGFNRTGVADNIGLKTLNPLAASSSLAAAPGRDAAAVFVGGLTTFSGGPSANPGDHFYWNSFQGYDDAFKTFGVHSVKFGVAFERMQLNYDTGAGGGEFHIGTLANFLTNHPDKFVSSFAASVPRGIRQSILGLYIQDDWRWRPNLTLNLGIRYEMSTVPTEVENRLSVLLNMTDATPHLGNPFFLNPTRRNFEPRVGFAWDPFSSGKTAVRGGVGIFDVLPLPYEFYNGANRGTPFFSQGTASNLPAGTFFKGAFPLLGADSLRAFYVEHKPPRNYVMQWNLNAQRELAPGLTAVIGYVGSHGVHQPFRADTINIVLPTLTTQGYLWPLESGKRLNSNYNEIRGIMYGGSSSYNALEVGVEKRMSHGFQFQTSLTWGKSIDTSSSSIVGDTFANAIASPLWFDLKLNRALSDYNVGRTLVINGSWEVPPLKSASGPAAWVTNGWQLGVIFKANDGVPFSATFGTDGDPQGLNGSDTWAFPDRLTGSGCKSLVNPGNPNNYIKTGCFALPTAPPSFFTGPTPMCSSDPRLGSLAVGDPTLFQCFNLRGNAGRNILIGPGLANFDFSIFKNNYIKRISESFNAQFRAEIFNIFNRPNFAVPTNPDNTDIFNSSGAETGVAGVLTSTTTTAREIQFALKVSW